MIIGASTYLSVNWSLLTPNFWHASSRTSVKYLVGVVGILNVFANELVTTTCDIMSDGTVYTVRRKQGRRQARWRSERRASTSSLAGVFAW